MHKIYNTSISLAVLLLFTVWAAKAQNCTSCTYTISGNDAGNYNISSGETFCIAANGNFTGSVWMSDGSILCNEGIFKPSTFSGGQVEVHNYGEFQYDDDFSLFSSAGFTNYATGTVDIAENFEFNNIPLINEGIIVVGNDVEFGSSSPITNTGTITVNGEIYSWSDIINDGTMSTGGSFKIVNAKLKNSGTININSFLEMNDSFRNNCNITVTTYANIWGHVVNKGYLEVGGLFEVVNGSLTMIPGALLKANSTDIDGDINGGSGSACSKLDVTGEMALWGSTLSGYLDYCAGSEDFTDVTIGSNVTNCDPGCTADGQTGLCSSGLTAHAGEDASVCDGESTTIGGSPTASGGSEPYTFAWSPVTGLSSASVANPDASPVSTTTYTVTVIDNDGNEAIDEIIVTALPNPTADAGGDLSLCEGESTTIGGSPTASGGSEPYTYAWSPATGLSSTTAANPNANPTSTTTYTVTVEDANGCEDMDKIVVTSLNCGEICNETTTTWVDEGNYTYKATSNGVDVRVSLSASGNAGIVNPGIGTMGPQNFWSQQLSGEESLVFGMYWDINEESGHTDIDLPGDDKGSGTISIVFDEPVYNPVLHIDRLGGWSEIDNLIISNSAQLTLLTPGVQLKKLAGTNDFDVTPTTITRRPDIELLSNSTSEAEEPVNLSAAAGSVRLLGVVKEVEFSWTGVGVEGAGGDAIEIIFNHCKPDTGNILADFLIDASTFCDDQQVQFTHTSQNLPAGATFTWDFGDGNQSTNPGPLHTYAAAGIYDVILTVDDGQGETYSISKTVELVSCPCDFEVAFTGPSSTCSMVPATFTNVSTGLSASATLKWNIHKQFSAITWLGKHVEELPATEDFNYTFDEPGTYRVWVVGKDPACEGNRWADMYVTVGDSAACCDATTSSWVEERNNTFKANSDGVDVRVFLSTTGNAGILNAGSETMGSQNFWSQSVEGGESLVFGLYWDITAETDTDIDLPGDDKGSGVISIVFDEPVYNPVLHIDRLGGWDDINNVMISNSAQLTLLTPGVQLKKLAGTDGFDVTATTISRRPKIELLSNSTREAEEPVNLSTAAGSVQLSGLVKKAEFSWTGVGYEGAGGDEIELILNHCKPDTGVILADFLIDASTFCDDQQVQFTNTTQNLPAGATFTWNFGDGNQSTVPNPLHAYAAAGIYDVTLTVDDGQGKTYTITKTVELVSCPCDFEVAFEGPSSNCFGSPVTFTNTSLGLTASGTLKWNVHKKFSAVTWVAKHVEELPATEDFSYTFDQPGTYRIWVVGKDSVCEGYKWADTIVTIGDTVSCCTVNAGDDQYICSGQSAQLTASSPDAISYEWSPAVGLSNANIADPIASPTATTTYTVTATTANGCYVADNVIVAVSPDIVVTSDRTICPGESVQLNVLGINADIIWEPAAGLDNPYIADPIATPATTTTYTIRGIDEVCLQGERSLGVIVTVLDDPQIVTGPDQKICDNGVVQLSVAGGVSYNWEPATGLDNPNISNPIASPFQTTEYTVTGMGQNGCLSTASTTITVGVGDESSITVSDAQTICSGSTVQLNATGGVAYQWSPAIGLSCTNCPDPVASPEQTMVYTVSVIASSGCEITKNVTVNAGASVSIDAGADQSACSGEFVSLSATGADAYHWSPSSGLSCTNCQSPDVIVSQTTTYTVTGFNDNCLSTDQVVIDVPFTQEVLDFEYVINNDCSVDFTAVPTGLITYNWEFGGGATANGNITSHTFVNSGNYEVILTVETSCGIFETRKIIQISKAVCDCNS